MWVALACVCIAAGARAQFDSREVHIAEQGTLRGFRDADGDIFTFLDVPYATAPNGSDKFKLNMHDDCLVANIFVPNNNSTDLPVLVYVHGGGHITGSGNFFQYTNLVKTQTVIIVTFNYRLGVHGFLCLGTEDVPGNAGMKDQVALLRWVNRNIANFGGNPNDVTIAGCSAGGTSVDLLTLSPMTVGLFRKVITESGSSIAYSGVQMDPIENAKTYARILNFTNADDVDALEEFYKTALNELLDFQLEAKMVMGTILFTPCVEHDTGTDEERFLSESPFNILSKGLYPKFPMLYGYTDMEGLLQFDSSFGNFNTIDDMSENFSHYLPLDLQFESEEQREEVAKVVREYYFGAGDMNQESILELVDYYTDILFAYPMLRGLKLRRNANNDTVYLYEYSFVDENTPFVPNTNVRGADHCAQGYAVMDEDTTNATQEYVQMKAMMREMWLNFIISGNPVPENSSLPEWPSVNLVWSPHMALNNNSAASETLIVEERALFWEDIYEKHYHQPAPPAVADIRLKMWCVLVVLIAVAVSCGAGLEDQRSRLVHIEQGPVRGHQDPSSGVFIFSSIPYATAPTGSQRFQAPLPPPEWIEPLDADKHIVCPQVNSFFVKNKVMQEDCLIANVYVPDTDEDNLSVIVYVHGGAFQIGYGDMVPPKNFMKDKKVIAVTFNYRLGINGFLCLGTKSTPGNAGLKDQVALLRWVKKNIASFGGNPDDVTIAGGSAGSVSVDLLMISKTTKGLFNKVIPESGASTGVIAMQIDPVDLAKNYAKSLGFYDVADIYALEKFLKSVPVNEFFKGTINLENTNSSFDFVPCVERETGEEMFMDDAPVNIIKKGDYRKVPMLFGFADMEGLLQLDRFPIWKSKLNEKFSEFLPADLQFDSDDEKAEVAKAIRDYYFGDKNINEESILQYIDYFTDVLFAYPTLRSVKLLVESGHDQIYLYEFSFVDEDTPVVPHTNVRGANHCAQTITVLDGRQLLNPLDVNVSEEYKKIRDVVQEMWYSFIKTGKPVPEGSYLPAWPPVRADRSPFMSLGVEVQLKGKLLEQRTQFWDDIYSRYYRAPQAPTAPPTESRLCVLAAVESQEVQSRLVSVEQGPIRGYRDSSGDIFEFINVPYATAPTGRHRFKAPLPPPVWVQPLEAVDRGIACHQSQQQESWNVREDCLVANIYAPDTNETNLSVVVYVHGGAYQVRRGTYNSVKALVRTKQIIAITFNYRLGIHGFLCLGTEAAPENAGMKDQVALIRWVKRNIASFGGNPDDITLVGCSAGGGSVDFLTLSAMTAGLFQRAIPQSGCNMGALGIQIDPLENAKNHARALTFDNVDDIEALEEFYTTASFELLATRSDLIMNREISTITFAPCVERDLSDIGIEAFMTDTPFNIMQSGRYVSVPLLYGFTNMEGGMRRGSFNSWKDGMNEKFSDFLIEDLQFDSEEQKEEVANTIKEFYFGDQPVSEENMLQYVNYFTDMLFFYPMLRSLKLRKESKNDTIFLYEYSFVDENSSSLPNTNFSGAAHCAQDNADVESRLVAVESGPILGYMDTSGEIFEFMNVPYATTPTGRHRFKAPLPPPVWVQPLEAVDRGIACLQGQQGASWNMREDCLVANIYTPATNETNLSVVVYIHGGAYQVRRGTHDSVKALVRTKQIIAITFNYRLGIHGFLCLGTEAAPGNAGMKDQVALIRWVKRNIASFGGNPDDITLVGCSAGGGSVDFLTLSAMTAGLFQRAIPQSGCNMGALGIQIDPLENAKNHARALTFDNVDDIEALEEFYTTAPFELLSSRGDLVTGRAISTIPFSPCVENDLTHLGIERFLNDTPVNIMQSGTYESVPLLYGFTNMEGWMRIGSFNTWKDGMNENFSDFLIEDLQFDSEEQKDEVANTIKEYYFGDQPVSDENMLSYVNYFTDILFFYPMLRSLKLRKESKNDTIFLYEYSFVDESSATVPNTNFSGATHCQQDNAVLGENVANASEEYRNMQIIIRELWINFILTG
ncbi:Carboxylesterase [Operophtera brumata]|uniref:Carboxylesterase n=1 Tax=Operophtera brumata TaxID=104452 RepID=A0A0L7L5N8_OPEBR|nr:Carboxylesterase [Operophtera brumata]